MATKQRKAAKKEKKAGGGGKIEMPAIEVKGGKEGKKRATVLMSTSAIVGGERRPKFFEREGGAKGEGE